MSNVGIIKMVLRSLLEVAILNVKDSHLGQIQSWPGGELRTSGLVPRILTQRVWRHCGGGCCIAERTPTLRLTWGGPPRGKDGPSGRQGCGVIVERTQGLT